MTNETLLDAKKAHLKTLEELVEWQNKYAALQQEHIDLQTEYGNLLRKVLKEKQDALREIVL